MIKIAYNEILVYTADGKKLFPNSNLIDYDIHPWHTVDIQTIEEIKKDFNIEFPYTLKPEDSNELRGALNRFNCQDFIELLDNHNSDFSTYTLDEVCENEDYFIYPIVLYNNDLFIKYETIEFPTKLVEAVKNKKAKICFYQPTEGFFGQRNEDIIWLYNLSKRYGFNKEDVIIITSNMISNEFKTNLINDGIIEDNFIIFQYNYFQHNLWFTHCKILDNSCVEDMRKKFNECLLLNETNKKTNHFLCFNRVNKLHRITIFSELMTNEKLVNKSITTLGATENGDPNQFHVMIQMGLADSYKHNKQRLLNFYQTYDSTKHFIYDHDDLENNKADDINEGAHTSTFLNIITESLIDPRSVFFSEKTFKPIAMAQPFVIYGNPFSLKKLKEYGFKTFDRWWDESYDNETDFAIRSEKIINTLMDIASWDYDKCYQVTQEMRETLIHNFEMMVSNVELQKLIQLLGKDFVSPIIKQKIKLI
jgi:hypothetical protein